MRYSSLALFNPCKIQFIFAKNHVENGYVVLVIPHGFWPLGMEINVSKKISIEYLVWYICMIYLNLTFLPMVIQFVFTKIHVETDMIHVGFGPWVWKLMKKKNKHRLSYFVHPQKIF